MSLSPDDHTNTVQSWVYMGSCMQKKADRALRMSHAACVTVLKDAVGWFMLVLSFPSGVFFHDWEDPAC